MTCPCPFSAAQNVGILIFDVKHGPQTDVGSFAVDLGFFSARCHSLLRALRSHFLQATGLKLDRSHFVGAGIDCAGENLFDTVEVAQQMLNAMRAM
jgi:hypothetical protein